MGGACNTTCSSTCGVVLICDVKGSCTQAWHTGNPGHRVTSSAARSIWMWALCPSCAMGCTSALHSRASVGRWPTSRQLPCPTVRGLRQMAEQPRTAVTSAGLFPACMPRLACPAAHIQRLQEE